MVIRGYSRKFYKIEKGKRKKSSFAIYFFELIFILIKGALRTFYVRITVVIDENRARIANTSSKKFCDQNWKKDQIIGYIDT